MKKKDEFELRNELTGMGLAEDGRETGSGQGKKMARVAFWFDWCGTYNLRRGIQMTGLRSCSAGPRSPHPRISHHHIYPSCSHTTRLFLATLSLVRKSNSLLNLISVYTFATVKSLTAHRGVNPLPIIRQWNCLLPSYGKSKRSGHPLPLRTLRCSRSYTIISQNKQTRRVSQIRNLVDFSRFDHTQQI